MFLFKLDNYSKQTTCYDSQVNTKALKLSEKVYICTHILPRVNIYFTNQQKVYCSKSVITCKIKSLLTGKQQNKELISK